MNTQAVNDNEGITKTYVDQFHQTNERSRRDVGLDFYDESNDFVQNNQNNDLNDNNLANLDSKTVNRNPKSDIELTIEKKNDDELDKNTILRFNQTLENYLKVSVGNDIDNLTKYDKIQSTDTTIIQIPNSEGYLLQNWVIKCKDKNNNGKIKKLYKIKKKTQSPTIDSGATSSPPIGDIFMYIEASPSNHGNIVFVSFERTDIIQFSTISFYFNRFSFLNNDSLKSMCRFRMQLFLEDDTWSTRYNIPKKDRYSDTSTDWTLVSLNSIVQKYGIKLIYDEIDTPHADICYVFL